MQVNDTGISVACRDHLLPPTEVEVALYALSALLVWCDDDAGGLGIDATTEAKTEAMIEHYETQSKRGPQLLAFALADRSRSAEPAGPGTGLGLKMIWMAIRPEPFRGAAVEALLMTKVPSSRVHYLETVTVVDSSPYQQDTLTDCEGAGFRIVATAFDAYQGSAVAYGEMDSASQPRGRTFLSSGPPVSKPPDRAFGAIASVTHGKGRSRTFRPYSERAAVTPLAFAVDQITGHILALAADDGAYSLHELSRDGSMTLRCVGLGISAPPPRVANGAGFDGGDDDDDVDDADDDDDDMYDLDATGGKPPPAVVCWRPSPSCTGRAYVHVAGTIVVVLLSFFEAEILKSARRLSCPVPNMPWDVALDTVAGIAVHPHAGNLVVGLGQGGLLELSPGGRLVLQELGTDHTPVPWEGDPSEAGKWEMSLRHITGVAAGGSTDLGHVIMVFFRYRGAVLLE